MSKSLADLQSICFIAVMEVSVMRSFLVLFAGPLLNVQ